MGVTVPGRTNTGGVDVGAFHDGGDLRGADVTLGTNDGFSMLFETAGLTRGRWTAMGELLVGAVSPVFSTDLFSVEGSGAGSISESVRNLTGTGTARYLVFSDAATSISGQFLITGTTFTPASGLAAGEVAVLAGGANVVLGTDTQHTARFITDGTERGFISATAPQIFVVSTDANAIPQWIARNDASNLCQQGVTGTTFTPADGLLANEAFISASSGTVGLVLNAIGAGDHVRMVANNQEGFRVDESGGVARVGFYTATPVAQQTGVAVSDAAIHAALVTLGLITA